MLTAIGSLWSVLSLIISALADFSFLQPYWFTSQETLNSLGIFSFCIRDVETYGDLDGALERRGYVPLAQACGLQGGFFHFTNLPSNAWQVACVFYGGGCAILTVCALLSLVTLALPEPYDRRVSAVTGYVQCAAVVLLTAGLVVLPVGLDSRFVRRYCSGATMYEPGTCQIGWAYLLAIVGTALAFFAPFLSQYTGLRMESDSAAPFAKPGTSLM